MILEPYHVARRKWQRRYLTELLTASGGNLCRAAALGHLNRETLYRQIRHLGLAPILEVIRKRVALEQLAGLRSPTLSPGHASSLALRS